MTIRSSFPTVLIVQDDDGVRASLAQDLRDLGYLVLPARIVSEAVEIARIHSRPIQVLLTDEDESGRLLAATLRQYRPNIQVVFLTRCAAVGVGGKLMSESVVAQVRDLLETPAET
jgi:ActR/RegA family two-component response regulator